MNALELIALDKLEKQLYSVAERCNDKNEGRMEHERPFIQGDIRRAVEILRALQQNQKEKRNND